MLFIQHLALRLLLTRCRTGHVFFGKTAIKKLGFGCGRKEVSRRLVGGLFWIYGSDLMTCLQCRESLFGVFCIPEPRSILYLGGPAPLPR